MRFQRDPAPEAALNHLRAVINGGRPYTYRNELDLQEQIHEVLVAAHVDVRREVHISPHCRPDFLTADAIAIEIKTQGSLSAVTTQLAGYLTHNIVSGLVLVTTRSAHLNMPTEIYGKPVLVTWISRL